MRSTENVNRRGLWPYISAVLPAFCFLATALLIRHLLPRIWPASKDDALLYLVRSLLLLPLALWFCLRSPRTQGLPNSSASIRRRTLITLSALCTVTLISVWLRVRTSNDALRILTTCMLAPVTEELIYRGAVQRRASANAPWYLALLLSAALFAIGHTTLPQILLALLAGGVFGFAMELTGSVTAPILLHVLWNLIVELL